MQKKFIYILLLVMLVGHSCQKSLDQQAQAGLDGKTAYTTKAGIEAGLLGVYDGLQQNGYFSLNYLLFPELYADNLVWTGTFPTWAQVYNKTILPDNTDIALIWNAIYSTINRANNVIDAAPRIDDASFQKERTIAECKVIRAMCYFDLIRMFGGSPEGYNKQGGLGVPLRLAATQTPADAKAIARATEAEVYTQILKDLDEAIAGLPDRISVGRVNKYVAIALKSRLQLYRGQWADAELLATAVITSPNNYSLVSGALYGSIYTEKNNSGESLWELQYIATDANTLAFYYYPSPSGRNEVSSSLSLRDAFEDGDWRKNVNFSSSPADKQLKYSKVNPGTDNVMIFRLAELYLTRAEARAMQNNLDAAREDLNVIRVRAGLQVSKVSDQSALLSAIKKERRLELAHEGQRFFDLRRYNETGITQTFRNLFPLPQSEITNSGNLVIQNPQY